MKLLGKTAVVTGGGRGIGRAIAVAFAAEGADVAVISRSPQEVQQVAEEIARHGRRGLPLTADVGDAAAVQRVIDETAERLNGLDILVNNAGGNFIRGPLVESDPAMWRAVIDSNLLGTYHGCRAAIPHMIRRGGGKIINVGSGMGHQARGENIAYNTAKAGVWMMTRCLATEVWQHGIDVNELLPGPVYTRLTADHFDPPGTTPAIADSERVKHPEECVPLAMFLAAHPAGGPTGQSFSLVRRPL